MPKFEDMTEDELRTAVADARFWRIAGYIAIPIATISLVVTSIWYVFFWPV